jgi:DNA-binding CsgD family transcriptional regulator
VTPRPEKRCGASTSTRLLSRRAAPSVYIVDSNLRVLHCRPDPSERRRDCVGRGDALPALVQTAVRAILARGSRGAGSASIGAADGSVVVRLIHFDDSVEAPMAVLVERLRARDRVGATAQRYGLSAREREVIALVAHGAKNREIARQLHIAESTAVFHVKRLLSKTGARNRTELAALLMNLEFTAGQPASITNGGA